MMKKADVFKYYRKRRGSSLSDRQVALFIARDLGLHPQAIWEWGAVIPKGRAYEIFTKSGGRIPLKAKDYGEVPGSPDTLSLDSVYE